MTISDKIGVLAMGLLVAASALHAQGRPKPTMINRPALATRYFGNDAPWYLDNIPFLEIDDQAIQRAYYYRWQVYRSHIRELGPTGTDETEFLPTVPWARHPYEDLNDSSGFHIMEGRWLRNSAWVSSLVDHLYSGAGNDRHFSEFIAAATFAWTQVTGDPAPALRHLDAMQYVYNAWDDHFDAKRNLYWIEPIADATEYTIGSIDASGAGFTDFPNPSNNGFFGGFAFRPSINAYQFGNAEAISALARRVGDTALAERYKSIADRLRIATLKQLWNPSLTSFSDVYQRSTATVSTGSFIRGRELVGLVPWMFGLPLDTLHNDDPTVYDNAWSHILSVGELGGPFGLRTVEPTYVRYMTQYRYEGAAPECQWNGPSWPFQTSQVLTGLANYLNVIHSKTITTDDFVRLLRQYTKQHWLDAFTLDLQEDYNPDTGKPIVGLPRSHHYNHSTYIDLILSGLLGIRPRLEDVLEINPLLPTRKLGERPISYFALEHLNYHGHDLSVRYDADGSHYHRGTGLVVFCDGKEIGKSAQLGHLYIRLPIARKDRGVSPAPDLAVNVWARSPDTFEDQLPIASASSTALDAKPYEAIDGRLWFFPEIPHGWSPQPTARPEDTDWYSIDLRRISKVSLVELALFDDGVSYSVPSAVQLQQFNNGRWNDIRSSHSVVPLANGITRIVFEPLRTQRLRVVLTAPKNGKRVRLIAFRVFASSAALNGGRDG